MLCCCGISILTAKIVIILQLQNSIWQIFGGNCTFFSLFKHKYISIHFYVEMKRCGEKSVMRC